MGWRATRAASTPVSLGGDEPVVPQHLLLDEASDGPGPGKYTAAKLIHWLHTNSLSTTAGVIENEKEPLETMRTFYNYRG